MRKNLKLIKELERKHLHWRRTCLNMIASENVSSPSVRERLVSDFECRYGNAYAPTLTTNWDMYEKVKWYEGLDYITEVEKICHRQLKRLFDANYADYRPISGSAAILANWLALTKVGDTIITTDEFDGGHGAGWDESARLMGRKIHHWPFDPENFTIEVDKARRMIQQIRPRLLVFGGSQLLFPAPLSELRKGAEEDSALCVYDGSHVLGLIAGKEFQDPLREGADVLFGSTHKSFPGPQGGVILSNARSEILMKLDRALVPSLFDNYHEHRVAALAVAACEMIEYGEGYAKQIVRNAKALAQALHDQGLPVICKQRGWTRTHQVIIDIRVLGGEGAEAAKRLASCNIITNKIHLPGDTDEGRYGGVRLGVSELTRTGASEADMGDVALLFRKALVDHAEPRLIRSKVRQLAGTFQKLAYSFDNGTLAYQDLN